MDEMNTCMTINNLLTNKALLIALSFEPTVLKIEKQVILNEISYDQGIQFAELGKNACQNAQKELESLSKELDGSENLEMFKKVIHQSLEDYTSLQEKMRNREFFKKIKLTKDVTLKDAVLLFDALQRTGWIEPVHDSEWQNYFELHTHAKNSAATIQTTRSLLQDIHKHFIQEFPKPGLRTFAKK